MTITCPNCNAECPDGKRFCGDCGAPLDPALAFVRDLISQSVKEQIQSVLAERYKDQKLIEIETTQAIASRLSDWTKLLAFYVGIPVAVLLIILGAIGIKTYSDFVAQVDKAQANVAADLSAARNKAEKLTADGERLAQEYENLRVQLRNTTDIAAQVDELSKRVDRIGEKLGFTVSSKGSEAQRRQIVASFGKYQNYLARIGYRGAGRQVELEIRDSPEGAGVIAYYDPAKQTMIIESKYATEPVVLYREYTHHVLFPKAPIKDSQDNLSTYYAIESALAWYLPCSFLGNPKPAAVSRWDITKHRSFTEIHPDLDSAMSDGTEVWGGAFWELRELLGQEVADNLLLRSWFSLQPRDVQKDLGAGFVKILLELDKPGAQKIRDVFRRRGLAV